MILLIGTGGMACDYAKVLKAQQVDFLTIGRGLDSARAFFEKTGILAETGGLEKYLSSRENNAQITHAIVAVGAEELYSCTLNLLNNGIKHILVEKPAGMYLSEIKSLAENTKKNEASVFVAYNRRFYASVLAAEEIINRDGGVESFNFELTEWGHVIEKLKKSENILNNWFIANTTHVVDLAFHLGGSPVKLSAFFNGSSDWHPRSYSFAGAGISNKNALFSYHGHWGAPGRWSVEILTKNHRFTFKPMELLHVQRSGSVVVEPCPIDDRLDVEFKPGIYKQTQAFLNSEHDKLCNIDEHSKNAEYYVEMAGYN